MNAKKTKTMCLNSDTEERSLTVTAYGIALKQVSKFEYLGQ